MSVKKGPINSWTVDWSRAAFNFLLYISRQIKLPCKRFLMSSFYGKREGGKFMGENVMMFFQDNFDNHISPTGGHDFESRPSISLRKWRQALFFCTKAL